MKALYRHNRKGLPFGTDLNVYTGCSHGCIYCYARSRFAERRCTGYSSFEKASPRSGIAEALEKELYLIKKSGEAVPVINLGGSCDSYQPAEKENRIMRDVLGIMTRYRAPVIMSTKSDLISRDLDLVERLSSAAHTVISVTITSRSPEVSLKTEPGAPLPEARAKALSELSRTGAYTGLHFFPVIPFLTDTAETAGWIAETAYSSGCSYVMPAFLYLKGGIRKMFLSAMAKAFPELAETLAETYRSGKADPAVKKRFYEMFYTLAGRYRLCTDYRKFLPPESFSANRGNLKPAVPKKKDENQLYLF